MLLRNSGRSIVANLVISTSLSPYYSNFKTKRMNNQQSQMAAICKIVSDKMGVSVLDMKLKTRKREPVAARQMAQYLIRKTYPSIALTTIGEFFNRDHSTVLHSIDVVEDMIFTKDPLFQWVANWKELKPAPIDEQYGDRDYLLQSLYQLKSSLRSMAFSKEAATQKLNKLIEMRNYELNKEENELRLAAMKLDQMMFDDLN